MATPQKLGESFRIAPPRAYYDPTRRRIATAIDAILAKGETLDVVSVGRWLREHSNLDSLGSPVATELHDISCVIPYVGNAEGHAQVIRDHYVRRERIAIEQWRIAQLREGKRAVKDIDAEANSRLDDALSGVAGDDTVSAPTSGPLAGFARLGAAAIVGYDALVAATAEPIQWVWQDICTHAHATEITGPSGGGKTTLAMLIACALANPTGQPVAVLGRTVMPLSVGRFLLLVEQENGAHSMRRKLEASCEALDLPVRETLDRFISLIRKNIQAGDATWQELRALARRGTIGATFIDSRARVLRCGDSNSEDDQAAIADELTTMIEESQGPCFVISHTKKGGDLETIEAISGSAQRGAGTDNIITVQANRDSAGRVTSSVARFVKLRDSEGDEYPEPVTIALCRAENGSCYLTESGVPERDERPLEARIEIELASGPKTKTALRSSLKRNDRDMEAAISNLFAAHRIRTCDVVVRGKPTKGFTLNQGVG